MRDMVIIDLAGNEEETAMKTERAAAPDERYDARREGEGLVEVAYDDSTIIMPAAYKAMWDEWMRQ